MLELESLRPHMVIWCLHCHILLPPKNSSLHAFYNTINICGDYNLGQSLKPETVLYRQLFFKQMARLCQSQFDMYNSQLYDKYMQFIF